MGSLRFCLLLAVLYSCSAIGYGGGITTEEPVIIPILNHPGNQGAPAVEGIIPLDSSTSTSTSSTEKPTTTSEKPTTTSEKPTTTSEKPTTTSEKPTTTSEKTTTTSEKPTTTTEKPTTTPAPSPAPTPAPTPLPPPSQGTWSYTDEKTNVTCIVVQFAAQLNVTYPKQGANNDTSEWNVLINVPANASQTINGSCTDDQWISITWNTSANSNMSNTLTLVYHKNDTIKNYAIKSFNVTLSPDNFVNRSSTDPINLWHGAEWQTPLATSYRCKVATQLNMTSDLTNVVGTLTLSRLQEEAYRTVPGNGFSAARECGGGDVPDAVPIAVGCALGGLVVVVLVAYLVGRRRSAARGYLSM